MINSNAELVDFVRGGNVQDLSDPDSNSVYITYYRSFDVPQAIEYTLDGQLYEYVLGNASVIDIGYFSGGEVVITSTYVNIAIGVIALAVFLALAIDWNARQPILWELQASSDVYSGPFMFPVFIDPVSIGMNATPHISPVLREF